MTVRSLRAAWNRFFFEPELPVALCVYRIVYGCLVVLNLLQLRGAWVEWYGAHPWLTLETVTKLAPDLRLNLFRYLPATDATAWTFFWMFLLFAIMLTCGLFTRISSIAVFLLLNSLQDRNLFLLHGGDVFMRIAGLFLIFAPAGAMFSVDRVLFKREPRPAAPWAQRMIQIQLSLVYVAAFLWKTQSGAWVNGTAVLYVAQLESMRRWMIPGWMMNHVVGAVGSWFTLALEFSLGVLVWIRELRYPILIAGIVFHLVLAAWLNVPLFQWDLLAAYILFWKPRSHECSELESNAA